MTDGVNRTEESVAAVLLDALRGKDADHGKVAVVLVVVQTEAHHEAIRDLEAWQSEELRWGRARPFSWGADTLAALQGFTSRTSD